jgi:alanine-glyoxylate transaminase / serine-glyoxylate transaminase / serine-pyruvate transaminase
MIHTGRHFLQIPGPTNVPDRVLRAIDRAVIDHRSPEFAKLAMEVLENIRPIFQTRGPVIIYPASGTGAWEAAIVNTLSAGDRVLMCETGHFSLLWRQVAERFGINVEYVPGNWRSGAAAPELESRLSSDQNHTFKAVMVVHNETSTGVTSRISEIRSAMDNIHHPALLIVDTISSLASTEYRHDDWGVDVTIGASQKGLMLPPGLCFNAVSQKAISASKRATLPRSYWDWQEMLKPNPTGFFPFTPATNMLYGLREALLLLQEEGLSNVFCRHERHAEATRAAVRAWDLEIVCENSREYSNSVTVAFLPEGHDADRLRNIILENFDMSIGAGLSKLKGRVFRIGHLGSFNDLMLAGTLSGIEMGLRLAGVPHKEGGVMAALDYLVQSKQQAEPVVLGK